MATVLGEPGDLSGTQADVAGTVVAVIPAYNEERFISGVVLTARQYTPHVIVVDDGSSDRTPLLARMAGADVVQMPENGGKGRALNAGFDRARIYDPDAIVMLDGDAQHDAAEILHVARPILAGQVDVVIGSRFLNAVTRENIPAWRRLGQHALTWATNGGSGFAITDSQSGYRAFSPSAMNLLYFCSAGLAVESEMQFLIRAMPLRVMEVPISIRYLDGNKRNPVVHGLEVLEVVFSMMSRRRPLLFVVVPGTVVLLLGVLVNLLVVHIVLSGKDVPVAIAVLGSLLIMVGFMMSLVGVILQALEQYVGHVREEVRRVLTQVAAT